MKKLIWVILIFILNINAQNIEKILDTQINAIHTLCDMKNISQQELNLILGNKYNKALFQLNRVEGAKFITYLQNDYKKSNRIPTKQHKQTIKTKELIKSPPLLASILEVGMSKRFHLIDENIIHGTIMEIDGDNCKISTADGILSIPKGDILEESVHISKKDDTRYVGPVLSENNEEITIRSKYGDIVINKKNVKNIERYHGGRQIPMQEDKKNFFQGEAVLTDIFLDPTAFPLAAHTFYISGLSIGYGFTDRIMIRTSYGSDFSGDLNFHPFVQLFHKQMAGNETGVGVGFKLFNRHPESVLAGNYSQFIVNRITNLPLNESYASLDSVLIDHDEHRVYGEIYAVYSKRYSLDSGRGKGGFHVGIKTNSLVLGAPKLESKYFWKDNIYYPIRIWTAFDYDLSKNLKLTGSMWYDTGNKAKTLGESIDDYFDDFTLNSPIGEYRPLDFDFGFIYAVNKSLRLGIHFQQPFFVIYWEFYEL